MKKLIIIIALLAFPTSVLAAEATIGIEFTSPTTRSDGSPLPLNEIQEFVFYDDCNSTPVEFIRINENSGTTTQVQWTNNSTHAMCFSTIDTDGQVGALSPLYNFVFSITSPPAAGTIDSVTVSCADGNCSVTPN